MTFVSDTIHIGFTGTSQEITRKQFERLVHWISHLSLKFSLVGHHGDCIGADSEFHDVMIFFDSPLIIHPPIYDYKRAFRIDGRVLEVKKPKAYLSRNKDIVDQSQGLIAVPSGPEVLRSGTWSTVRYARKKLKPILIFMPDGSILME